LNAGLFLTAYVARGEQCLITGSGCSACHQAKAKSVGKSSGRTWIEEGVKAIPSCFTNLYPIHSARVF